MSKLLALRSRQLGAVSCALVLLAISILLRHQYLLIDGESLGSDATQNFNSAINLLTQGVYSEQPVDALLSPGFRREPFPNFITAIWLGLGGLFSSALQYDVLTSSMIESLQAYAKNVNLFYSL